MARQIITMLIDDIDGSDAEETVRFGLDGKHFTIDLNAKNAAALRKALAKYTEKAAPDTMAKAKKGSHLRAVPDPSRDLGAMRLWARENGYTVGDKGRIPAEIEAAYNKASAS